MNTKLTLRMDESVVQRAKSEARRRGKSVSRMVVEYFDSLGPRPKAADPLPPVTASLVGILKGKAASEDDYKRHLRQRHL